MVVVVMKLDWYVGSNNVLSVLRYGGGMSSDDTALYLLLFFLALGGLLFLLWWLARQLGVARARVVELERVVRLKEEDLVACSGEVRIAKEALRQVEAAKPQHASKAIESGAKSERKGSSEPKAPRVVSPGVLMTATELLCSHGFRGTATDFFNLLERAGLMEEVWYQSSAAHGMAKSFRELTASGLNFGENIATLSPVRTEPRFYKRRFAELVKLVVR